MLDQVEVWRLWRPLQSLKWLLIQPFMDTSCHVFGVPVLLENDPIGVHVIPFNRSNHLIFQDLLVQMLIHYALNSTHKSRPMGSHTAPDHDRTSAMLDRLLDMARLSALSVAHPTPRAPI